MFSLRRRSNLGRATRSITHWTEGISGRSVARRVGSAVLALQVLISLIALPAPVAYAAPDSSVTVSNTVKGTFSPELVGGNLSPWGLYWPDTKWNPLINDAGIGILRWGHASKYYVDMEKWYPSKGCTPDWDAQSGFDWIVADNKASFNQQIAWLKGLNMPVMYTLTDEMSTAMLKPDGTLDYPEIARAWTLHIKHMLDAGVDIRWVEIGNECDIQPTEGIQYPPVAGTNGGSNGSSKYIDIWTNQNSANNEYIKLWSAVYPALKAQFPNLKIGAYPSGMGPVMTDDWPFNYLFQTSPYKPDFFAYHLYPMYPSEDNKQKVMDKTWSYAGSYVGYDDQFKTIQSVLTGWGAPANIPIFLTEYNYDAFGMYTANDAMWDGLFVSSAILNSANGGIDGTYLWDTFCGSYTGGAIGPNEGEYRFTSQGLGLRLMKQFKNSTILANTVTTSDLGSGPESPNDGHAITPNVSKRIECLSTRSGSTYKIMLVNKNMTTAHEVALNLGSLGLSNQSATVEVYDSRADLQNNAPTVTNANLSGGSTNVAMPALSAAIITVTAAGGDTTAPTVSVTAPANGATVSGSVPLAATASDNVGVTQVEFRVDGTLVGTDATAPYAATWDSSGAATGSHTIQARAYDAAGNTTNASVTVTKAAPTDTTAPTVSVTAPANGATVSGNVALAATASDNVGVTQVEFRVDGTLVGTDATAPYASTWNSTGAAVGAHTIQARAYDAAGNTTNASVSVNIAGGGGPDTTAPTVSVTSPTNGSKVTGAVSVTANASDNTAVSKVEFRINGRLVGTDTTAPYSTTWSAPSAYTQGPVVSFTFDDGMDIQYSGCFPILSAAGFPATTYVHSGDVVNNYDWKLSLPELTALRDAGWEISNHTSDHWDSVTDQNSAAQLEPPVAAGKAWLDANGFPNSGFASPNAWVNPTITSVVKKYHTYNRTSWGVQELPPADPYMLKVDGSAAIIDNNPSVTALRAMLDDAVANKRWVIFLNHVWNPPSGYFTTVVNEVKARNLPVATVRDVLGGPYAVEATAYDAAGNKATSRVDVTSQGGVTPPADTTAPTVSITSPANGATVSGSVALAATASDNVGVTQVEFRVDGTLVGTDATSPYAATWNAASAAPGSHTIQARAYDAAGNTTNTSVTVTVPDSTAPTVSITSPANGATVSGTVALAATASDNVGVSRVEFRVDGTLLVSDTSAPYSTTWNAAGAAPGTHTIQARAYDAAGNTTNSSVTVTVPTPPDIAVPAVSITAPANGATVSGTVNIAAAASDNVGVAQVEFRVDGALIAADTSAPYGAVWNAAAALPGPHTVEAKAFDQAGNSSTASITVTVPAPATPPTTLGDIPWQRHHGAGSGRNRRERR